MADPHPGEMILYDDILPPLLDNSYRMSITTDVSIAGAPQPLNSRDAFFNVEGPRFSLSPTEVGGVFPPRNGHGAFSESIPHIAILRRTLPWERELDPQNLIGTPSLIPNVPPPQGQVPWMALLLFEEGEYTLLQNQPLEQVVPADVFQRLGSPANIRCDAIEASLDLVNAILPSKEELQLLAHVRHVNKDDRELSIEGSKGFFAVVMGSRLPNENAKCRACLVSLEERSDLVSKDPPANELVFGGFFPGEFVAEDAQAAHAQSAAAHPAVVAATPAVAAASARDVAIARSRPGVIGIGTRFFFNTRLVLLYSWQFQTIGTGSFRDLMQGVDVGLIGKVANPGHPPLTDTCHLPISVDDRAGVPEKVLYRGPLVPFQLTRDTLGPYHSADQARRVTPETGAEDISYACAFETGRLLASADPRLAQELMRWRREAYKQSSRGDSVSQVQSALNMTQQVDLHLPVIPILAQTAVARIASGAGPIADPTGIDKIKDVIGLNPIAVQKAYNLPSVSAAVNMLGGDAGALGAVVTTQPQTSRPATTIDAVAADSASLAHLTAARDRILNNTAAKLGGKP
jgi:hypothetical protein